MKKYQSKIIKCLKIRPMTLEDLKNTVFEAEMVLPEFEKDIESLVSKGKITKNSLSDTSETNDAKSQENSRILYQLPKGNGRAAKKKTLTVNDQLIEEANKEVENSIYGDEDRLITQCLTRFPKNDNLEIVAMKIALIDVMNSTHLSQQKEKMNLAELAKNIVEIKDIDEKIQKGDPAVVEEIAGKHNCKQRVNLLSFASKYCCYHNKNLYGKDDYSIFDTILKKHLPDYFGIEESQLEKWRKTCDYQQYNDFIGNQLDQLNIHCTFRRRKFDRFVWYNNR